MCFSIQSFLCFAELQNNACIVAGDSLSHHNNMRFSTKDFDNDNWAGTNCAYDNHGAWWYNACQYSNLNGEYLHGGQISDRGINWYHWKNNGLSMRVASMKMRDC